MATKQEGERLARLEEKVDNLSDDVKAVILKLDSLDEKFSAKWVEKVILPTAINPNGDATRRS